MACEVGTGKEPHWSRVRGWRSVWNMLCLRWPEAAPLWCVKVEPDLKEHQPEVGAEGGLRNPRVLTANRDRQHPRLWGQTDPPESWTLRTKLNGRVDEPSTQGGERTGLRNIQNKRGLSLGAVQKGSSHGTLVFMLTIAGFFPRQAS